MSNKIKKVGMKNSVVKHSDNVIQANLLRWFELASDEQIKNGKNWYIDKFYLT